ncbi:MAG: hypothetical protein U9Q20_06715 [Campylobacterota bacterium]|nr:hypothetical protein [Campylobacterota bacterium]
MRDYKTITFYRFAQSIGAIKSNNYDQININDLLLQSFIFLNQDIVLIAKKSLEFNIFKDKYNEYLEYCISNNLINKDSYKKVEKLNTISVPDMSKIKIPDISKELKAMNIDLDKFSNIFGKISK